MIAKRIFFTKIHRILVILALFAGSSMVKTQADTLEIKADAPQQYTVVKGDTLWDLSGKYLDQPWRWPELWEWNPQIENPHLIYPGDVISLSYSADGQPRLDLNRSQDGLTDQSDPSQDDALDDAADKGPIKLSPKIRSTPIVDPIPVIPVEALQQFLHRLEVVDKVTMEKAPYIVRIQEERLAASLSDRVYVKGLSVAPQQANYQIYHIGDPIHDPATGNVIAHESLFVGDAKLVATGDPATLLITYSAREALIGDRIVARKDNLAIANFYPQVPNRILRGQVLKIIEGIGIFGRFQAVIINLGRSHGLSRGHVLSVFSDGKTVLDNISPDPVDTVTLPGERAGTLMIIKTFENLSYALAMESRVQMRTLDEVRTPE